MSHHNTPATPHDYFVSFTGWDGTGQVFGWQGIGLAQPIRSGEDIKFIEGLLRSKSGLSVVKVLIFQRFER